MQGLCYLRVIMLQLCLRKWRGKAQGEGFLSMGQLFDERERSLLTYLTYNGDGFSTTT